MANEERVTVEGASHLARVSRAMILRPMSRPSMSVCRPHNRSLNLSNAVAVTVFEAWRQQGFEGAAD